MIIYWTNLLSLSDDRVHILADTLTLGDKARYHHIRDSMRRNEFLIGRMMIYRFCGRDITISPNGKPMVKGCEFSLSHSHHLVALAVGNTPVGLDVELIDKTRPYHALAKRLNFTLSGDECDSFYRQFTQYESDYKCGVKDEKNHYFFTLSNDFIACVSYLNNNEKFEIKEIRF